MRELKRAIHFDFHSMPDYPDLFSEFEGEKFAETLKDANVGYINFFARCNVGFSYYPTKVGVEHPYLHGRDILGSVISECHKKDIGVTAYFNAGISHEIAAMHSDWTVQRKDGRIIDENPEGAVYRKMCYNTGYREHLKNEIKEVLSLYPDVDGIFVDCFILPQPCYCPRCIEAMRGEGIDASDDGAVLAYHKRKIICFALELAALVPNDKYFYINGLSGILDNDSELDKRIKYNTHAEIESLPTGGWSYNFFPATIAYNRNLFAKRLFMTGRFHQSWGDFGGIRTKAALEYDAYNALMNCAQISIGDHLHPRGVPEKALMGIVKDIFGEVKKLEKWTDGAKHIADVAVFNALPYDNGTGDSFIRRGALFEGIAEMLGELKIGFDIVDDSLDISKYKLLILPDVMTLSGVAQNKIKEYLQNGGKILSSGSSGLNAEKTDFALPEWDFVYQGEESRKGLYMKVSEKVGANLPDMPLSIYDAGIRMLPKEKNEVLADLMTSYFDKHWDGRHSYDTYMPYNAKTGESVILKSENVLHIAFPIFSSYRMTGYHVYKDLIGNCIDLLCDRKLLWMDAPSFTRAGMTEKDGNRMLHILSYCPEKRGQNTGVIEEGIKLYDVKVKILDNTIKKVYTIPDMHSIEFSRNGDYTEFIIPFVDGHGILMMEREK